MPHKDAAEKARYHREYKRLHRANYAERQAAIDAASHANARAALYGAPGLLTIDEAAAIRSGARCHYCASTQRLGLDHVIPLHTGGANRPDNIVLCCGACNASKYRQDRPRRWSRHRDYCADCGTADKPHKSYGLCTSCYARRSWHVRQGGAQWPSS